MALIPQNLLALLPARADIEYFETLLANEQLKLERIVSRGNCGNPGHWYDQDWHEWVLLMQGAATLRIEGQVKPVHLRPGDCLLLPAHVRHAVTWTEPDGDTLWLALHFAQAADRGSLQRGQRLPGPAPQKPPLD